MDDFLDNYEILGKKMRQKLPGESGAEKLDVLRRAMGQDERVRIGNDDEDSDQENIPMPFEEEDKKSRWDCETILSTSHLLSLHILLLM